MVISGINFSTDKTSSLSQIAVSAFVSGSTLTVGLWDKRQLVEVRTLDVNDSTAIKDCLSSFNVNEVNLVHDSPLFGHSDFDSFDPLKFDKYFPEDKLKFVLDSDSSAYEKLKQQKIFTLSYISEALNLAALKLHKKVKLHHISTAMANYSLDTPDNLLVLIGQKKMSLIVQKGGFKEFLQYDLESGYDFLYYILLAAKNHDLDVTTVPVNIGGNIDISSPLYQTLKAHIYNLTFCTSAKFQIDHKESPIHYYLPLLIARACA